MDTEKDDQKKIVVGKNNKKSQIIINPPEKVDPQRGYQEAFRRALQKHTVVMEKKTEVVLQAKADRSQFPADVLEQVYKRGFKNLPLNTNLTREQYAMNRVNSFIAGGAAMKEDCDLLPIVERVRTTMGMKGTGGAMRPHIKRERSPYNNKMVYHVVDSQGRVKHSTTDEGEAKQHLATKYNSYMEMAVSPMKRFEGTKSLIKTYKDDTPGEKNVKEEKMKGEDPCWKGYHMVGKKLKAGREVPNCVPKNEEVEKMEEQKTSKSGIIETDVYGTKAYHAKCLEPGCKFESKRFSSMKKAQDEAKKHAEKEHMVQEETEQINELSKSTLGSYIKKAANSAAVTRKIASDFEHMADRAKKPSSKQASTDLADKYKAQSRARRANIGKAVDRLTKEEVEKLDELKKSTVRSYANKKQAELDDTPPMPFKKPAKSKAETEKAAKGMMGALARLSGKKPTSEATSPAIRMQKALEKIKADRERREKLAAPYVPVKSVFAKPEKDDKK